MVPAQKQTHRSVEQNGDLRDKPMHIQSINQQQRRKDYKMGEKTVSLTSAFGKLDKLHVKNKTRPFSHTIYKNKLKVD